MHTGARSAANGIQDSAAHNGKIYIASYRDTGSKAETQYIKHLSGVVICAAFAKPGDNANSMVNAITNTNDTTLFIVRFFMISPFFCCTLFSYLVFYISLKMT